MTRRKEKSYEFLGLKHSKKEFFTIVTLLLIIGLVLLNALMLGLAVAFNLL